MITPAYVLERPAGPGTVARFINWRVMPSLINGVGAIEKPVEQVAHSIRRAPLLVLGIATVVGFMVAARFAPQWRR